MFHFPAFFVLWGLGQARVRAVRMKPLMGLITRERPRVNCQWTRLQIAINTPYLSSQAGINATETYSGITFRETEGLQG